MNRTELLHFLHGEANKEKIVRLSLREIAHEMDVSHQTIKVVLGELESLGEIEIARSKSRRNIIKVI